MLTAGDVEDWAERYFRAWVSNDPAEVAALFSEEAVYHYGPFRPPAEGRAEIVRRWVGNAQQDVHATHRLVAINGDTAVIHWGVVFRDADGPAAMDGILIVRFDDELRCVEHREWYHVNRE